MIAKINPTCFTSNQARKNFIEFKEVFSWENSLEEQFIQPVANAIHSTNADLVFDKMKDILVTSGTVPSTHWGVDPVSYDLKFDVFDKEEFESFDSNQMKRKLD